MSTSNKDFGRAEISSVTQSPQDTGRCGREANKYLTTPNGLGLMLAVQTVRLYVA